jgi:hypothetical protein
MDHVVLMPQAYIPNMTEYAGMMVSETGKWHDGKNEPAGKIKMSKPMLLP